jgi:hypothetical protein
MRQTPGFAVVIVSILAACVLGAAPALADPLPGQDQESRVLSDRLNISLGYFEPNFSTTVAAGFGGVLGAFINVERQLQMNESLGVFRLDGFYRFNARHAIDWTYSTLNRDGITVIDESIEFGDPPQEFRVGAVVASKFNTTLFATNFKFSFINNGKVDAGVSAGLFTYEYDLQLAGKAAVLDPPGEPVSDQLADTRLLAPLPAFGMFVDYAIRKNLVFRGNVRALNIEFGDFTGKFLDTKFTLDWYFYKHLGIGIGAARTSIDFRDDGDDPFRVTYEYGGFMAYLAIAF